MTSCRQCADSKDNIHVVLTFYIYYRFVQHVDSVYITVFFSSFDIVWKHVSFPNGTVYLPSCTVILVMALAYASPAGSAVLLGNYTLLFGKVMHFWIHVVLEGLI